MRKICLECGERPSLSGFDLCVDCDPELWADDTPEAPPPTRQEIEEALQQYGRWQERNPEVRAARAELEREIADIRARHEARMDELARELALNRWASMN